MKKILEYILYLIIVILLILGTYYFSYKTGGYLTTADSCSSQFIIGEIDIKVLKKNCPNISKNVLIEDVNDYFNNHSESEYINKNKIIKDIEDNF